MTTMVKKKGYILEIFKAGHELEDSLSLMYNAFVYDKNIFLGEANEKITTVIESKSGLSGELVDIGSDDQDAAIYAPVAQTMVKIAEHLESISHSVKSKINENLLFSDKGISELNFLIQRLREIINTTNDLIIARNTFVADYIIESVVELERTADKFRDLQEDRLIGGVCLPKASGVYISILDAVKDIAWNIKAIAEKLK